MNIPCPAQDNGICAFPDPAVAVIDGEVSLVRPALVERLWPNLELHELAGELASIDEMTIREQALKRLGVEYAGAGYEDVAEAHVESLFSELGEGVLVYCSPCGHTFAARPKP